MTLTQVVNIELEVMRSEDAEAVAAILKKAHSSWEEVQADFYNNDILPGLVNGLRNQSKPVVLGRVNGRVAAAYDPPDFVREDSGIVLGKRAFEGFWTRGYAGDDDYFAVDRERSGIGTAFFGKFGAALRAVSMKIERPLVHRVQATHRSLKLFVNLGYGVVYSFEGLHRDYHIVEKAYSPNLVQSANPEVVLALIHQMNSQISGFASSGSQ